RAERALAEHVHLEAALDDGGDLPLHRKLRPGRGLERLGSLRSLKELAGEPDLLVRVPDDGGFDHVADFRREVAFLVEELGRGDVPLGLGADVEEDVLGPELDDASANDLAALDRLRRHFLGDEARELPSVSLRRGLFRFRHLYARYYRRRARGARLRLK